MTSYFSWLHFASLHSIRIIRGWKREKKIFVLFVYMSRFFGEKQQIPFVLQPVRPGGHMTTRCSDRIDVDGHLNNTSCWDIAALDRRQQEPRGTGGKSVCSGDGFISLCRQESNPCRERKQDVSQLIVGAIRSSQPVRWHLRSPTRIQSACTGFARRASGH